MSLLAMPLIVVNLGAEMVYILDQRLKAQCIAEDKSHMVLNDVVRTWFDNKFIEELFKPQQLYSLTATRQIFERLAHSSIMRLNQSSMEKLFDLMVTGLKYQTVCNQQAQEILQVTLLHLHTVKKFLTESQVKHAVDVVETRVLSLYEKLTIGQWRLVRQTLCSFFQDRRIKVSLFMQEGIQVDGARVVLPQPVSTGPTPPVGTLTTYQPDGQIQTEILPMASTEGNPANFFQHPAPLGSNLYDRDRVKATPPEGRQLGAGNQPFSSAKAAPEPKSTEKESRPTGGLHELSLLATLIKPNATKALNFKLNLFGDTSQPVQTNVGTTGQVKTLTFQQSTQSSPKQLALQNLALDSADTQGPQEEDGDDLLDLLDSVAQS